jgi:hypothetical protein
MVADKSNKFFDFPKNVKVIKEEIKSHKLNLSVNDHDRG